MSCIIEKPVKWGFVNGKYKLLKCKFRRMSALQGNGLVWGWEFEDGSKKHSLDAASGRDRFRKKDYIIKEA